MKYTVGFYRRGDRLRASLIAECVVEAVNIATAKKAAVAQLAPAHPELGTCLFWHAALTNA